MAFKENKDNQELNVTEFNLEQALTEICMAMGWNHLALPEDPLLPMSQGGVILGAEKWIDSVISGNENCVVMKNDFKKITN